MVPTEAAVPLQNQSEILRPLPDFPDDIWSDHFDFFSQDQQVYDMYAKEIKMLKEEVRNMLLATENTITEKLSLIDIVQRLGISYHYGAEIANLVEKTFKVYANTKEYPDDLLSVALHFRLFRQHGFNISESIFYQFVETDGKFKESLSTDMKGLLSLYEAAQVRTHKDIILEEALAFAEANLKHVASYTSHSLAKQVNYTLKQALHKCIPRIEARHYISVYEEDECRNQLLLKFAKLDYNLLQMLYKQELSEIIRWGNESEIVSKLPYSRARLVESYFYGLGMFFEPQHSLGRIISAKTTALLTAIDDTYDSYGTLDELITFTDAIERWDAKEIDRLSICMRTSYLALLNVSDGVDNELTAQQRSYASDKYKDEWKQYARSSYIEALWFIPRELPAFPDYLSNGLVTSLCYLLIPTALLAMECATEEVYDWLSNYPKILVSLAKICRLTNDIGSYEREKQYRGTGIECYMKHYNVSELEAKKKFADIAEDAWKDINEEFLKLSTTIPTEILERFLNLARIVNVFYKQGVDGFTNPHNVVEPHIIDLLRDPIIF
ncbi:viridiflorene synthase-like [Coffea eugenioides]|uniref:viridiflorene synthase-like n=1 Tax=Coffea eugenioides TaxID=49369 RepID=UPI000F6125DF|nr:viridiflorene synthase-like [Coffea eugenioides]